MAKSSERKRNGAVRCALRAGVAAPSALALALAVWRSDVRADDYQSYSVEHKDVHDVEKLVLDMLAGQNEVHVVADPRARRLLVSGPENAQRLVRELVNAVDKPAARRNSGTPVVRAYPCPPQELQAAKERLRLHFADDGRVRVSADTASSQLLVVASPEVHETIRRELGRRFPEVSADPPAAPLAQNETAADRFVPVQTVELKTIESNVVEIFGARLRRISPRSSRNAEYEVVSASKKVVRLTIDQRRNGVRLSGPGSLVDQLVRLIGTLDRGAVDGAATRVVPVRQADPTVLKQAIDAYRHGYRAPADSQRTIPAAVPAGGPTDDAAVRDAGGIFGSKTSSDVTLTGHAQLSDQESAPPADADAPMKGQPDEAPDSAARRRLRQLGSDVQIESLEDLDTLILRGSPRDVEELTRIIKEIERLSAQTVPVIEIVPLKNAGSSAIADVVTKVNLDLVGALRGRVTVVPLAKPNALLVIGWGEAVKSVKGLIAKLDQPVGADSQFRAFRLKHAAAASVSTSLTTFFAGRANTPHKVTVVPDPRTNSVIVHASPSDIAEAAALVERLDTPGSASVNQARIFKLTNSLAADLATTLQSAIDGTGGGAGGGTAGQNSRVLELMTIDPRGEKILKSGVLSGVRVTPDPHRNSLIVQAPPESMDLLEALIRQLDEAPAASGQIKVFRIVNGDATAMIQMLRSLLPAQVGPTVLPQLPAGKGEAALSPLRFAIDLRTNSIIATGSSGDLKIIEALLLRLDEREVQQRKNVVYRLKNAPANAVAAAINDFLRSERQVQQAGPGNVSPFQQIESEVVVVPEPISNALILSATPRFFSDINQLVEQLDSQPPQVMIQVLIAEVELNDADQFGVELGIQDSLLFDRSLLSNLLLLTETTQTSTASGIVTETNQIIKGATNTPGFNFNTSPLPPLGNSGSDQSLRTSDRFAGQAVSNFAVNRTNDELGFSGLVLSAGSESLNILIRALQESRRLEILSRPQVMTLDNQPAYIQVGQRVPRIVASTINQLGQVNSIELENVGLILAVTPRISPDGMVVLEVDAEKSDVGPEIEGIPVSVSASGTVIRSPRINLTTAQTTVSASSGETIVLGGLITKSTNQLSRRIPWLSDVPLLGNLFRYDSLIAKRRELLVIMTPYVVRNPQDAEAIKQKETARLHWTCADVQEIHGAGDLCRPDDCRFGENEIPVIQPDLNPRGFIPNAVPTSPTPNRPDSPESSPPAPADEPQMIIPPQGNLDPVDGPGVRQSLYQADQPPKTTQAGPDQHPAATETNPGAKSGPGRSTTRSGGFWKRSTVPRADKTNRLATFPPGWGR